MNQSFSFQFSWTFKNTSVSFSSIYFFLLCAEHLCVWVRVRPALMHGWIVWIFNLQNVSKQTTTIPSIYMRFMNNDVLLRANVRKLKLLSGKSFAKLNESKCSLRNTSLIHPHLNGRWLNKRCYVISLSTLSLSIHIFLVLFAFLTSIHGVECLNT